MTKVRYITVFLYHGNIADTQDKTDPTPNLRCISCGRLLGRAHGRIFALANTQAPSIDELPVGVPSFETKCPQCNLTMHLIWQ